MKKIFLISFISIVAFSSTFAQLEKGRLLISLDGNFAKNSHESSTDISILNTRTLNLSPAIGFSLAKNFTLGLGVDLSWNKQAYLMNITELPGFQTDFQVENSSNSYLPYAFLGYYYEIFTRFYVGGQFHIKFGFAQEKQGNQTNKGNIIAASISPEINYFISRHFAVYLSLGEFGYSMSMFDNYDKSNWLINFSPTQWALGIRVAI
ncbi:hypothetical protein LJB95_03585 [Paludibacteraceae bacterium OttesenSCG-928-F17]|nr:hypothetical protein [Paludibacteraceae bacterium OttesenSCG-928-F17]